MDWSSDISELPPRKRPRETRRPPAFTPRHAFEPVALAENMDGGGAEIDMAFILATQTWSAPRLRFTKDASFLIAGFFRPGVRGMSALAAGLRCECVIARKAALCGIDTLSALSPSFGCQSPILRKTSLFVRYACAALPRNRKLFFSIHGGKASG